MELLLIRHALPVRVAVNEGFANPGLDEYGHEQAKRLAEYLGTEPITAIYASSMLRAQQTAEPLAQALGITPVIEPAVTENDTLAMNYTPAEELKAAGDPRWRDGFSASDWPEYYEPLESFHARIVAGLDAIIVRHPRETVAVFTHSGVIARYTAAILELPWERTGFFFPLYTSITRIAGSEETRWIVTVNETPHLRGTDLPTGALF